MDGPPLPIDNFSVFGTSSRDRDVCGSGETARVLDSASWVDEHSGGWSLAGDLMSPRLREAELASTCSSCHRPKFVEV